VNGFGGRAEATPASANRLSAANRRQEGGDVSGMDTLFRYDVSLPVIEHHENVRRRFIHRFDPRPPHNSYSILVVIGPG
jgi:hypothetical protein